MSQHLFGANLLIVTTDGYGKRIPTAEIRRTNRGAVGVRVSRVPVAIAMVVDSGAEHSGAELVIATTSGKVQRIRVDDVPIRSRAYRSDGQYVISNGARVVRLRPGDRVAAGSRSERVFDTGALKPILETDATGMEAKMRMAMKVALSKGESVGEIQVHSHLRELAEIPTGGSLPVARDEWVHGDVHAHSSYWCRHCGAEHGDPQSVYECIDRHVAHPTH